jgi:hypothetical protein
MRPDMIKTYWQTMDKGGKMYVFNGKPTLVKGCFYLLDGGDCSMVVLFPIELKPLQIAEITVNENGTWSWEIEREDGWYFAKEKSSERIFLANNKRGKWTNQSGIKIELNLCEISSTRIPDECII